MHVVAFKDKKTGTVIITREYKTDDEFFGMSKQDAKKYIKTATPEILNTIYDGWKKQATKTFYVD